MGRVDPVATESGNIIFWRVHPDFRMFQFDVAANLSMFSTNHKIPPSVRPLGFVAIYRLVHKWLLLLFVPIPNSAPSLFTPALELRAGPLEDPSQEV